MDESVEDDVVEEIKEEFIETPKEKEDAKMNQQLDDLITKHEASRLSFNDVDFVKDTNNNVSSVSAPKDPEVLEQISTMRNEQRRLESLEDEQDGGDRLKIFEENVPLGTTDVHVIDPPSLELMPDLLIDDIEVLA
jgi:hypothetical protein